MLYAYESTYVQQRDGIYRAYQHLQSVKMLCALKNQNKVKVIKWVRLTRYQ